jgi:hypothetical protein
MVKEICNSASPDLVIYENGLTQNPKLGELAQSGCTVKANYKRIFSSVCVHIC